ncbi:MAG: fluoride efflux transporter CrcB [Geobacter sp.]|uniref:fluoride efflux transporter CrcB n=1 Tax=Trichlorobacter sp. TaxID=2911007 RepID=UPI002A366CC1|nr:fluoride efflux transporter CrcB [Trichlorobacter sp.]MDY0383729.1 fluoride efflux transporter CrcB [Trichlorobacter sp.]
MATVLSIALFGAAGCLARYWLSSWVNRLLSQHPFPFGTLAVNLLGAFLIGLVIEFSLRSTMLSHNLRVALTIGFLGGLTTFSTFSVETFTLLERGQLLIAFGNMLLSVTLCLLATWGGIALARLV